MSRFARSTALLSVIVSNCSACEHDDRCQLTATCPPEDDAGADARPTPKPSPREVASLPAASTTDPEDAPTVEAGALGRLPLGSAPGSGATATTKPVAPVADAGTCSDCDATATLDGSSEVDSKPLDTSFTDSGTSVAAFEELGAPCTSDAQCESDHCATTADGASICCDTACRGICEACSATGSCSDVPLLDSRCTAVQCDEPEPCFVVPPTSPANQCSGFGQCLTATEYCVPTPDEGANCGSGLVCDAQGKCGKVCSHPLVFCGGECILTISSHEFCGADDQCQGGSVCGAEEMCIGGNCEPRREK